MFTYCFILFFFFNNPTFCHPYVRHYFCVSHLFIFCNFLLTLCHFSCTCSEATAGGRSVKQKQAPTPTRVSARLNKGAPTAGATTSTRSSPRTSTSNTGHPVVLEDLRKTTKKWVLPICFFIYLFFVIELSSLHRDMEMHPL